MNTFLKSWIVLFLSLLAGQSALLIVGFMSVDIRFERYAQLLVIPAIQAILIGLAAGRATLKPAMKALFRGFSHPLPRVLLCLDVVLLGTMGMAALGPAGVTLLGHYAALKGVLAASWLIRMVWVERWTLYQRGTILAAGIALSAYSFSYWTRWMDPFPEFLFARWPLLFQWLFFYGGLFSVALVLIFQVRRLSAGISRPALALLDLALALAFAAALVVLLGFFNRPYLVEPWPGILRAIAVLFQTSVLAAGFELYTSVANPEVPGCGKAV